MCLTVPNFDSVLFPECKFLIVRNLRSVLSPQCNLFYNNLKSVLSPQWNLFLQHHHHVFLCKRACTNLMRLKSGVHSYHLNTVNTKEAWNLLACSVVYLVWKDVFWKLTHLYDLSLLHGMFTFDYTCLHRCYSFLVEWTECIWVISRVVSLGEERNATFINI